MMVMATVRDVVEALYKENNAKTIEANIVRRYLTVNKIRATEKVVDWILEVYNRKALAEAAVRKSENGPEYDTYINAKKELDNFISTVSVDMMAGDIIELKKRINNVVDKAILWSHTWKQN
jgi:hypothetical protein